MSKPPSQHTRKCSVSNCPSVECDKIMLVVPKDEPRRTSWEKAVGNSLRGIRDCVCEDHFLLQEDAENWVRYRLMPGTKLTLKKTAVPHLFGHNSSQSQFSGYAERLVEMSRSTGSQKKKGRTNVSLRKTIPETKREPDPSEFLGVPFMNQPFDGNLRAVPCSCEAGRKLYHNLHESHLTTGTFGPDACLEPEVTIKEEPEECTEQYDFPLVIVKEEPVWGGMGSEDTNFKVKDEPSDEDDCHSPYKTSRTDYSYDKQNPGACLIRRHDTSSQVVVDTYNESSGESRNNRYGPLNRDSNSYGCIEIESSEESESSYPSSPPTPEDDSDADPEFNIEYEKMEESTDDEKLEYEPRKLIPEGAGIYICYWCNKKCRLRRWMKCHLYKEHSGEKPYACNKCEFRTSKSTSLRDHKYAHHSSKRRFNCDICNKRYATNGALYAHKNHVHRSEKRFSCDHCDFKTNYREKLKMHIMRHTGEKPLACKFCEARFIHPTALKTHTRIHTGEKPYACDSCDYRCRQGGMLTAHKRVHHPEGSENDS